jgi:PPK2 family polyphosphate:nucleotide phosphotransferase
MSPKTADFFVSPDQKVRLKDWPTSVTPIYSSTPNYKKMLEEYTDELKNQQRLLYASNSHALLIIFQAMDAAGKDGVIQHVMSGVNPQGCQVFSFKHPSPKELNHDFLWRTTQCLPERGYIGIFNRSYYEEVLIVRVHPHLLRSENLPTPLIDHHEVWEGRYRSIVDFEAHLARSGTKIIKFFLHLSKEEQRQRFLDRINKVEKNWKFSADDLKEREYWDLYMEAYEACLSATSSQAAPWFIVPADDKKNARLFVSRIIVQTLQDLKMTFPKPSKEREEELEFFRQILINEGPKKT